MALLYPRFLPTRTYPFSELRDLLGHQGGGLQEGVVGATDLKVAQRGAGANMSVDVALGAAWVKGDDVTRQGVYDLVNDATLNQAVSAAHASLPRIDQVVARVYDSSVVGVSDTPAIEVVAGTPTAGATLDNRLGVAALPNGAVRLADVLVPAASASVTTANIRDRRPWARGAYRRITRTQNAAAGNDYSITATSLTEIDATNLMMRLECTGNPMRMRLRGRYAVQTGAHDTAVAPRLDAAAIAEFNDTGGQFRHTASAAGWEQTIEATIDFVPAAGSHVFTWAALQNVGGHSSLFYARAGLPLIFTVEELVLQNADNT